MSTRPRPTCRTAGARRHHDGAEERGINRVAAQIPSTAAGRFPAGPTLLTPPSPARLASRQNLWAASALDLDRGAGTKLFCPRLVNQPASSPLRPPFASNRVIACVVVPDRRGWVRRPCITVSCPYPAGTRYTDAGCMHGRMDYMMMENWR